MAEEHPVMRMTLQEVKSFVADLEERYRVWALYPLDVPLTPPRPPISRADLLAIRESLQRSLTHLDRLLGEGETPEA